MTDSRVYVSVGAFYCVAHEGIANEHDATCDFAPKARDLPVSEDGEPVEGLCDFRQLYWNGPKVDRGGIT